jgi:hypothetical protein
LSPSSCSEADEGLAGDWSVSEIPLSESPPYPS